MPHASVNLSVYVRTTVGIWRMVDAVWITARFVHIDKRNMAVTARVYFEAGSTRTNMYVVVFHKRKENTKKNAHMRWNVLRRSTGNIRISTHTWSASTPFERSRHRVSRKEPRDLKIGYKTTYVHIHLYNQVSKSRNPHLFSEDAPPTPASCEQLES